MGATLSRASLIVGLAIGLTATAAAQWTFYDLHPPGATRSVARGVYNGVVVGDRDASIINGNVYEGRAMMWSGGVTYDITPPSATAAYLTGTNGFQHVGQIYNANGSPQRFAARWNQFGTNHYSMHVPGQSYTGARGVSPLGNKFVGFGNTNNAYLWYFVGKTFMTTNLNPAGYNGAGVTSVYGDRQVGAAHTGSSSVACAWNNTASSFQDLHWHGVFQGSKCWSVFGTTAVGEGWNHPFTYSRVALVWNLQSGISSMIHPEGYMTSVAYATGTNCAAGTVSYYSDRRAFYWDFATGTTTDLQSVLDDWAPGAYEQSEALAVYRNGGHVEVVGWASDPYYLQQRAMLWVYDPPS